MYLLSFYIVYALFTSLLTKPSDLCLPIRDSLYLTWLNPIIGKWEIVGMAHKTPFSTAHPIHTIALCQWSADHQFLIIDEIKHTNPQPQYELTIIREHNQKNCFDYIVITSSGNKPFVGTLHIRKNVWEYDSGFRLINGEQILMKTLNKFTARDTILYCVKYSQDKRHWHLMSEGKEIRLSDR